MHEVKTQTFGPRGGRFVAEIQYDGREIARRVLFENLSRNDTAKVDYVNQLKNSTDPREIKQVLMRMRGVFFVLCRLGHRQFHPDTGSSRFWK